MKKDLIDYVIRYASVRALWLYESTNNGAPLRIQRLDRLEAAYFKKILTMYYKEV